MPNRRLLKRNDALRVVAIGGGTDPAPSFEDGLQVQRVLAAVEASAAADSLWQSIDAPTS